ncbi:FHA domain-containing protein [Patescibacteria group bacterium]|nr:FHA domain-containing protein [Patescibacteria group bacterium]MCG2701698.1 FHA domain-containing protein [Candidatus Parcubacteria bacterium]MBU4265367.1 FHA domain-containing protein [Patescibacteria group bacterium]MBU4390319.1 FHA domain-containing protein [Patescibacteria group bacterium]MBU4396566.1 FHA domain-containing protein [Patescibacteria group bacterium]
MLPKKEKHTKTSTVEFNQTANLLLQGVLDAERQAFSKIIKQDNPMGNPPFHQNFERLEPNGPLLLPEGKIVVVSLGGAHLLALCATDSGRVDCMMQDTGPDISISLAPGDSIGRSRESGCKIVISDSRISRQHIIVQHGENGFFLQNLGPTNGTCVWDSESNIQTKPA